MLGLQRFVRIHEFLQPFLGLKFQLLKLDGMLILHIEQFTGCVDWARLCFVEIQSEFCDALFEKLASVLETLVRYSGLRIGSTGHLVGDAIFESDGVGGKLAVNVGAYRTGRSCQLRRLGARGGAGKPTLLSLKN
jgi:hypothetical protein